MNAWLQGLLAAVLGGAATGALQATQSGVDSKTGVAAGVGAVTALVAFLSKSPIQFGNNNKTN